jgi:flagellar biogenesis protein FliO
MIKHQIIIALAIIIIAIWIVYRISERKKENGSDVNDNETNT